MSRPAPLLRLSLRASLTEPAASAILAIAVAVLVAASVAVPMLLFAAGNAALELGLSSLGERTPPRRAPVVQTVTSGSPDGPPPELVDALAALPELGPPSLQIQPIRYTLGQASERRPAVRRPGDDRQARAVLFHHSGALSDLEVVAVAARAPTPSVWIPDVLADGLELEPGDLLDHGSGAGEPTVTVTVAGIYRTRPDEVARGPLPISSGAAGIDWGRLAAIGQLPPDPEDREAVAWLLLADRGDYRTISGGIGEMDRFIHEVAPLGPLRLPQADAAAAGVTEFVRQVTTSTSALGRRMEEGLGGPFVDIVSGLPSLVVGARATADELRPAIVSVALATWVIALGVTVAASSLVARRRRPELRRGVIDGDHPAVTGLRFAVERLPAIVLGGATGWLATRALITVAGPGSSAGLGESGWFGGPAGSDIPLTTGVPFAALALLAAIIAVAATSAVHAVLLERVATGRAEHAVRRAPWPWMVVLAATLTGIRVVTDDAPTRPVDALSLAFPVLAIVAASWLVLRGVAALVARRPTGGDPVPDGERGPAAWLLRRRLLGRADARVPMTTLVAAVVGLLVYAVMLGSATDAGVSAKIDTLAGSQTTVQIDGAWLLEAADAADEAASGEAAGESQGGDTAVGGPSAVSDVVWRAPQATVAPDLRVDVLAVDLDTFAAVALRPGGLALEPLLEQLDGQTSSGAVPALVIADHRPRVPGEAGFLVRGQFWSVPFEVVARPPTFPGAGPLRPLVVLPADLLFDRLPDWDPRAAPPPGNIREQVSMFDAHVWSSSPLDEVLRDLDVRRVTTTQGRAEPTTRAQFAIRPTLVAAGWSTDFLVAAAIGGLLLGVVAIAAQGGRRSSARAVEAAMLARMGIDRTQQRRLTIVELLVPTLVAVVVGTGVAAAVAGLMIPRVDALPAAPPSLSAVLPVWLVIALILGTIATTSLVAAWSQRRLSRRPIPEVLRAHG